MTSIENFTKKGVTLNIPPDIVQSVTESTGAKTKEELTTALRFILFIGEAALKSMGRG